MNWQVNWSFNHACGDISFRREYFPTESAANSFVKTISANDRVFEVKIKQLTKVQTNAVSA